MFEKIVRIIVVSKVDNKVRFSVECTEWEADNMQAELAYQNRDCRVYIEMNP